MRESFGVLASGAVAAGHIPGKAWKGEREGGALSSTSSCRPWRPWARPFGHYLVLCSAAHMRLVNCCCPGCLHRPAALLLAAWPLQAWLAGGQWHRLLPPSHPGLPEVKWCMNRFVPFLVVDPQPDPTPGSRDAEEASMEVRQGWSRRRLLQRQQGGGGGEGRSCRRTGLSVEWFDIWLFYLPFFHSHLQ